MIQFINGRLNLYTIAVLYHCFESLLMRSSAMQEFINQAQLLKQ